MLTRGEACRISGILDKVCEARRKVIPGYGKEHVLKTINILSREPTGRLKLSKLLDIGEASTRTLLKRLREEDLIVVDPVAGAELSDKGKGVFAPLLVSARIFRSQVPRLEGWGVPVFLCVKNMGHLLDLYGVLRLRDMAISSGAEAAIIGVYTEDHVFRAPGMDIRELKRSIELILDRNNVMGGSLIVVLKDGEDTAYRLLAQFLELMCGRKD